MKKKTEDSYLRVFYTTVPKVCVLKPLLNLLFLFLFYTLVYLFLIILSKDNILIMYK